MAKGIWIIAEQRGGNLRKISYELTSEGRRLADQSGQPLAAVVVGSQIGEEAKKLIPFGPDTLYVADDPALADYTPETYTAVLADLIKKQEPDIVLLGASAQGKELAAKLAARLETGMAQDCVSFRLENGLLIAKRPLYAGKVTAEVVSETARPQMAAARPNVLAVAEPDPSRQAEIVAVPVALKPDDVRTTLVESLADTSGKVDLTEATFIVSGGRGMKASRKLSGLGRAGRRHRRQRGGLPFGGRCRLAVPHRPGGPDREGGLPQYVHRLRHLRGHPAPGRNGFLQDHCGHQQGPGCPHLPEGGLRDCRGPV